MEKLKAFRTGMAGIITQVNSMTADMAEPFKSLFQKVHDDLNGILTSMPPLEQVPAAQTASYGLDIIGQALLSAQTMMGTMMGTMQKMREGMATQMNGLVETALQKRVTEGLLVTKEQAGELVKAAKDTAAQETRTAVTAHYGLMTERRGKLKDLPLPGESVLGLPEEQFTPAVTEANRRKEELEKKGIKLDGAYAHLAWLPKEQFEQQLGMLKEVLGEGGGAASRREVLLGGAGSEVLGGFIC